jgi:aryl sulfotransferase
MGKPQRIHTYTTGAYDSVRWDSYRPRGGDIIVATPVKSGTTWTQMICALLVHQAPTLPAPLTRLSRWLERHAEPIEKVIADFDAQPFRRVIKTHTPLDGLPYFEDVVYVFCGRDPRDVYLSMCDHAKNLSDESLADIAERAGIEGPISFPDDPNEMFEAWLTRGEHPWMSDGFPWGSVFYITDTYWHFRTLPNVFFLHYADLSAALDAEMRRLSAFLGIPVDEERWPSLVEAAEFESMKKNAAEVAPGAHFGEWRSAADFFRLARKGQWRDVLSAHNQALYERVAADRLEPRLRAWLEGGRAAAGDPKSI